MYNPDDDDDMVICPYVRHHIVSKLRIQKHIMKCQKNNPHIKLVPCFYNFSHKLKPEELLSHYKVCTHKTRLDSAQYVEPVGRASFAFVKRDFPQNNFPDVNVKTKFFSNSSFSSSQNQDSRSEVSSSNLSSKSEIEGFQMRAFKDSVLKTEFYNAEIDSDYSDETGDTDNTHDSDDNDDDELEPLPLPKTVSKAFVFPKQHTSESSSKTETQSSQSNVKRFGRGKYLMKSSSLRNQIASDHLSEIDNDSIISRTNSIFSLKDPFSSCSASFRSLKLDDESTIKSEEIIFDDDFD